ncbi:cupin [Streptomyces sp. NPDC004232]|uniref:cupin n=1 Tax=Streptomyces sp. NPDC004232 TaxID=3154454 RepID=UPI001D9FAC28|nr:cupin [Streptomyces sp. tea 10]
MTLLQIMPEDAPETVRVRTGDVDVIHKQLLGIGVRFARWHAARRLPADADDATIRHAYRSHIEHLGAEGYPVADIARVTSSPGDRDRPRRTRPARARFRAEHFHDEDVVRFVVHGAGCFYLHVAGQVHAMLCTAGDLLSVPGRTPHWFDAGARPCYTAIRFFQEAGERPVRFLPDGIAARFPAFDELPATS